MNAPSSAPVRTWVALLAVASASCVAALLLAGGAPPALPPGMADPGPLVGWALRLARPAGLIAGVLTVGSLLVAAVLDPGGGSVPRSLRLARRAAAAWALTALVGYVASTSDIAGAPLSSLTASDVLTGWTSTAPAAQLCTALLAAGVAVAAGARGSRARARVLLVVALTAALPVPVAGHVAVADDGGVSLSGLVVHVVAALVWTGGLAGLLVHLHEDRQALAVAVRRYSALALWAYISLAASGVIAASAALPFTGEGWETAWASGYAGVLAAKVLVLVVLGAVGLHHRRRTLPLVQSGRPRAFVRLAAGELVVMAAGAGLATGLSQTPVPPMVVTDHAAAVGVEPLSLATLLTSWRPNAIVLLLLASVLMGYLHACRQVDSTGRAWPRARTGCFVAGVALGATTLCSGVATYAPVLLSVHLAQLLVMLLGVPALLLLGRPAELARTAYGRDLPRALRHVLASPATGAVATCVLVTVVYRTPVTELSLRSPWWHLLVLLGALVCGTALLWPVLGDADAARVGRGEWLGWWGAVVVCLAVLALRLRTSDQLVAAAWFLELRLGWSDPVSDQRLASTVAGIGAIVAAGCSVLALRQVAVAETRGRGEGEPTRPSRTVGEATGARPQPDQEPAI